MSLKEKIKKGIKFLKRKEYIPIEKMVYNENLLEGKIALITGGSSGIGLEIAKSFLKCNCKVIIASSNEKKLKKICEQIDDVKLKYLVIDVTDIKNMKEKVKTAFSLFEENKIDILVNSAGVVAQHDFFNTTEEDFDNIMSINMKGTFFMSKFVSELMIKNNIKGHILNLSSSSAIRPAWTPYQMSKWSIRGLTLGLADMLIKYGIVVNSIAPGPTATPMLGKQKGDTIYNETNPSGRYVTTDEVANLAIFMVSGLGNMIVGDTFYITGGSGTISYHN